MPATETTIANVALGHIGNARILDIGENSVAAEHCRRMWATTRDAVLRQFPWNFAIRRTRLTASASPPSFGWARQFPLPPDCLKALAVNECPAGVGNTPWQAEGAVILTDFADCRLRYVARVEATSQWDPTFQELFGYELAKAIAPSISLQPNTVQMLDQLSLPARSRAQEACSTETRPRVIGYHERVDAYTAARYGASGLLPPSPERYE